MASDYQIELPFLENAATTINTYLDYVRTDPGTRAHRTKNDEQNLIYTLSGIGSLIEYNIRAGYQHFARKNNIPKEEFYNFSELVQTLGVNIEKEEHRHLLTISSQVRNKLVHADFPSLYQKTKEAYELPNLGLFQDSFEPVVRMVQTTMTKNGLNLDLESATATDNLGDPIPAKPLIPGEGGAITLDFAYFYESGHFIHVYDVLFTCFKTFVFFQYDHA